MILVSLYVRLNVLINNFRKKKNSLYLKNNHTIYMINPISFKFIYYKYLYKYLLFENI